MVYYWMYHIPLISSCWLKPLFPSICDTFGMQLLHFALAGLEGTQLRIVERANSQCLSKLKWQIGIIFTCVLWFSDILYDSNLYHLHPPTRYSCHFFRRWLFIKALLAVHGWCFPNAYQLPVQFSSSFPAPPRAVLATCRWKPPTWKISKRQRPAGRWS